VGKGAHRFLAGGGGKCADYGIVLGIDVNPPLAEIILNTFLRAPVFNYNIDFY